MPPQPFRRALALAFAAALIAAVVTSLADVGLTWLRATEPVGAGALASAVVAALGLYGGLACALALAAAVVVGAIVATVDVPALLGRTVRAVRTDDARDRAGAAGLVAAAAALGVLGLLVLVYDLRIALEMAAKRNSALTTAMVAVVATPIAALAWFPIYRLARPLVAPLPRPRTLVVLGALVAVAALGIVAAVLSVDWRVIDFGPAEALALFTVAAVAAASVLGRAGRPRRALPTVAGWALLAACLAITWVGFGGNPRAVAFAGEESMGEKVLLKLARRFADRDHDGFAGRLGGGDCDDHNRDVHPGADEVRGNHVDEDCDGSDAPAEAERRVAASAAAPASEAAARFTWKGNILVITIDTLRADRLTEKIAPHLYKLMQQSVRFTRAYAQAPNTPRSFPSFLTSRYPSEVRWQRLAMNFPPMLETDDNTTFFQALRTLDIYTVGVFSHFYLTKVMGLTVGFDEWHNDGALTLHDSNTDSAAPRIAPRVIAKLGALAHQKMRFALWTHFFEPHSRYMEHDEFPVHAGGMQGLEQKYDAEISFADKYIGEVLDSLDQSGLGKDTAVVVFSDHGEAFGEHRFGGERMYFHGQTLYDELLRVPLMIRVPGISPRAIDAPVQLIDLGPTLCDLVKARRPPSMHGRSLLGAMLGEPPPRERVYAELLPAPSWNHHWRAIVDGTWKLIDKLSENTIELYDLAKDPTEQHNVAAANQELVGRLGRAMKGILNGETG